MSYRVGLTVVCALLALPCVGRAEDGSFDSMGGTIALKLLVTHPERLLSATLGGSGGLREGAVPPRYEVIADSLEQGKGFGPLVEALTPPGRPRPTEEQMQLINRRLEAANDT